MEEFGVEIIRKQIDGVSEDAHLEALEELSQERIDGLAIMPVQMCIRDRDKEEKNRADYYNYYTGNRWGDINNYDFAINTSKVSFEEAADLIYRFAKDKQKNLKDR